MKIQTSDIYHSVIHLNTYWILALFCLSYLFACVFFSVVYSLINEPCGLKIKSWLDAFYLSLELGTTIGWGVPDMFFSHCYSGAAVILAHTLTMNVLNALLVGLLYCRVSRGENRAASVCFSEKAVIREMHGRLYFMFQVCEMRKHQLTMAHVRCYAFIHRPGTPHFEQRAMRILHPDDNLGSCLLLTVPALVVHEIDAWSPFSPDGGESAQAYPGLVRRAVDADAVTEDCTASAFPKAAPGTSGAQTATRQSPGVVSSIYQSAFRSRVGVSCFASIAEREAGSVLSESTASVSSVPATRPKDAELEPGSGAEAAPKKTSLGQERGRSGARREDVEDFLRGAWVEILVIVEGIEATTSNTVQARYSYRNPEICFDKAFAPAVYWNDGSWTVDFEKMSDLVDAPPRADVDWFLEPRAFSRI